MYQRPGYHGNSAGEFCIFSQSIIFAEGRRFNFSKCFPGKQCILASRMLCVKLLSKILDFRFL
jgi:hypothetical protein